MINPDALKLTSAAREQLDRVESGVIKVPPRPTTTRKAKS